MNYPNQAPYVYLDEPVNETVIEMMDYVDKGNRIVCELISKWAIFYLDP